MADEPETLTCEWCEKEYPADAETAALRDVESWKADYCPECRELHFVCEGCGDITHVDDAPKVHATMCESCGDSRNEELKAEALDVAAGELQELVDALVESDDLAAIRAAVVALKAIRPAE